MAETNTMDVIFVDYLLPGEPKDAKKHHVTLKEFLALPPEQLTEQNQKIQKTLGRLYQLNDRKPPLFNSFPKRKTELVINCTPIEGNVSACYVPNANRVNIVEGTLKNTESALLQAFAHELKHAEQFSEELYEIWNKSKKDDGSAFHQLSYLIEAQAYAFGNYVYLSHLNFSYPEKLDDLPLKLRASSDEVLPVLEKHVKGKSIDAFPDIEYEMMDKILPFLYNVHYCDKYNEIKPISDKDKGLTEGDIPNSFHFKNPKEVLSLLNNMPREARTPIEKIRSAIAWCYPEKIRQEVSAKEKSISSDEVLDIIKTEFARSPKDVTRRHVRYSKDMLEAFLDFKVDEKPFMQEKDILDLLEGARASGRKDVEDALLAYKTDHPDDERFAKINFSESEGIKMTALQDEFYAKHPYLAKDKLFANLPDRVINEMNAFEVRLDKYIADGKGKNFDHYRYKLDAKSATKQQRYLCFMEELIRQIANYTSGEPDRHVLMSPSFHVLHKDDDGLLYDLKRSAPKNNFPFLEGYDNKTIEEILNKKTDERSDKEKEIIAACGKKQKQFEDYLKTNFTKKDMWMWQSGKGWKHGTVTDHRFQLAIKPSVEALEELKAFADKYDCTWKCPSSYLSPRGFFIYFNDWTRVDSVDIYTAHSDKEGQKKDLAAIVDKYGYDKAHCDVIDRFFDSERIANGAYMAEEWTRKDVEDLVEKAGKLDAELAEYGKSCLKKRPTHPNPMSAGMFEAYRTSINTYEAFVDYIGGPEKAKEPVIPTKGATRAPSKSAAPAPTPSKSTSKHAPTPSKSTPTPAPAPAPAKATIIGSGATSKTAPRKIVENPFAKMPDDALAKALAAAKDGTYWKFGLTVEQKSREAKKAGEDVPYFVYSAGGEHHEVVSTFTKDLDKEVCGKANKVLFSGLPEGENTSEGNPHAEAPLSKHLEIQIDITEGTGTSSGDKAAYQKAQSLLLAAYDSGVRRFTLTEMTPEEIKIWGDVRAALAGQGKSLEFVFDNADSQKTFDSHKADFAKIEDLNKTIHDAETKAKVAEYKKRKAKEAEATKIKAVAGKKPVPALAAAKAAKGR